MQLLIHLHAEDNVLVALTLLRAGQQLVWADTLLTLAEEVPFGHKISLRPIAKGEHILKYGVPIGHATTDIAAGRHVHLHNVASNYASGFSSNVPLSLDSHE